MGGVAPGCGVPCLCLLCSPLSRGVPAGRSQQAQQQRRREKRTGREHSHHRARCHSSVPTPGVTRALWAFSAGRGKWGSSSSSSSADLFLPGRLLRDPQSRRLGQELFRLIFQKEPRRLWEAWPLAQGHTEGQ